MMPITRTLTRALPRSLAAATALAAALTAAAPAQANYDYYLQQISLQIEEAEYAFYRDGYVLQDTYMDVLTTGHSVRIPITLSNARRFTVFGVCDHDCRDLDLKLFDNWGQLIDEDVAGDDQPYVEASWPGQYVVEVSLYHCATPDCAYGIALFAR